MCDDLKVCGRREFSELLKMRINHIHSIEIANKSANEKRKQEADAAKPPKTQEELEDEVD